MLAAMLAVMLVAMLVAAAAVVGPFRNCGERLRFRGRPNLAFLHCGGAKVASSTLKFRAHVEHPTSAVAACRNYGKRPHFRVLPSSTCRSFASSPGVTKDTTPRPRTPKCVRPPVVRLGSLALTEVQFLAVRSQAEAAVAVAVAVAAATMPWLYSWRDRLIQVVAMR